MCGEFGFEGDVAIKLQAVLPSRGLLLILPEELCTYFSVFFLISWSVGRYIMPLSSGLIYVDTVACFSEDNEFNIGCQFLLC